MADHEGFSPSPVAGNNGGKGKQSSRVLGAAAFAVQLPTVTVTHSTCVYVCDDIEIAGVM